MALMQISIIPLGTPTVSVGDYVAEVIRWLDRRQIDYTLEDMGTEIQAPVAQLFEIAKEIHEIPFGLGLQRVVTHIVIDDRRDRDRRIGEKKKAVVARLEGSNEQ